MQEELTYRVRFEKNEDENLISYLIYIYDGSFLHNYGQLYKI